MKMQPGVEAGGHTGFTAMHASTLRLLGILGALALLPAAAAALSAPPALYNKSISISWTEGRSQTFPDGKTNHRVVTSAMSIYFSSAGRMFVQSGREVINRRGKTVNQSGRSKGPNGDVLATSNSRYSGTFHFEGRNLVSDTKYESGARRVQITFDESYHGCSLQVVFGKEGDTPGLVHHGMNGRLLLLTSVQVASPTCSVREGNAFGQ